MNRIEEWLGGCSRFRQEILGRCFHYFEPSTDRATSIHSLAHSWSTEHVVEASDEIYAWFEWLNGQHRAVRVPANTALELYRSGVTIYAKEPRFLTDLADEVANALKLPRKFVQPAVFCNHPGAVSRMHFDASDTLTVQIRGSKRWTLAPNIHAPAPLYSWATLDEVPRHLQVYAQLPFPAAMPPKSEEFLLQTGAMLYIPRGTWHQTLSEEESISLHIHLLQYSWADAILATLRDRLVRDEAWRKNAYPLWDPEYMAHWCPEAALEALRAVVADVGVGDLVRVASDISSEDRVKSRARSAFESKLSDEGNSATFTVEEHGVEHAINMEMSPEYLAAARLVASSRDGISADELTLRAPNLEREEALRLVRLLVDIGYARRA